MGDGDMCVCKHFICMRDVMYYFTGNIKKAIPFEKYTYVVHGYW